MTRQPRRQPKKPSGDIGPLRLSASERDTPLWRKIPFSDRKDGQEALVGRLFASSLSAEDGVPRSVLPQPEYGHDLLLVEGDNEKRDLQLMEVILPLSTGKSGKPYEDCEEKINVGRLADKIISGIRRKRYGKSITPLYLILYITHWRFRPNDRVLSLVVRYLENEQHAFDRIYFVSPFDADHATVLRLFPNAGGQFEVDRLTPSDQIRRRTYFNANPASFSLQTEENAAEDRRPPSVSMIYELKLTPD